MSRRKNCYQYAEEYYQNKKDYYESKGDKVRISKILKMIGNNKKILDIGCYDGTIGEKIKNNNNIVFGIDASEKAIMIARSKGIRGVNADIGKKFPFKNNTFNTVFAGEIIEHILDTDFFLEEIKRVLKSKGELVITTPNVASLGRRIYLLLGLNPYFEAAFGYPDHAQAGHVRFYTKGLLLSFLEYKGFKILNFESDVVNFTNKISSKLLAEIFPTLGRGLIVKCRKI